MGVRSAVSSGITAACWDITSKSRASWTSRPPASVPASTCAVSPTMALLVSPGLCYCAASTLLVSSGLGNAAPMITSKCRLLCDAELLNRRGSLISRHA